MASSGVTAHQTHLGDCGESELQPCKTSEQDDQLPVHYTWTVCVSTRRTDDAASLSNVAGESASSVKGLSRLLSATLESSDDTEPGCISGVSISVG